MKFYGRFLLVVVIWGALAFGAVYPWAYWPLVIACTGMGLWGAQADAKDAGWQRWFAGSLAVVALGAIVQLIPLPRPLLLVLGPSTDKFLAEFSLSYAANPGSHALSIAPERTQISLALFAGFAVRSEERRVGKECRL